MKALKYSRQRESIEAFLKTRCDHPTADVIYNNIRLEYPNISLGTVYRNLSLLAGLGRINIVNCGDGVEHFDADTTPHYHFKCKQCGRILDVLITPDYQLNELASDALGCPVTGHSLVFEGICKECSAKDPADVHLVDTM